MDMTVWLEYFVRGLKNQMLEVRSKGEAVIRKEVVIERAQGLNLNDRQQKILMYLHDEKRTSVDDIEKRFNFVRRTIQRDLSKMIELGFVKEVAKSKTDPTKYYELL